jgi:flagellar hook-associated protein 1 FlgK
MSINFSSFEIARRALSAQQLGIAVTGQNISNVNTQGYSRQRVQLAESLPSNIAGFSLGTGVSVAGIETFRDMFIESRLQTETGIAGRLTARRDALAPVEVALQGGESGGLQNAMAKFFGAFRDLEASPQSVPLRSVVAQAGEGLASAFRATRTRIEDIQRATDGQLRSSVENVNVIAEKIADLNGKIRIAESTGGNASPLIDQRGELVREIADLTGARSVPNADGTLTITIGDGRALVSGDIATPLTIVNTPPTGFASVEIGGGPAVFDEGRLKGLNEALNEMSVQLADLDALAGQVVARVNALHSAGTDLDGNPGTNFFDATAPVTAANMRIDPAIAANPRGVVASPLTQPGQNGTVAGEIAGLLTDPGTSVGSRSGSFSSIFSSMVSDAGESIRNAEDGLVTQAAIIAQVSAQRDAVSGVSLDEEAINLMQYQRAFEAAARFMRVADEMTQTILSLAQ